MKSAAIIGGGVSGLSMAHCLKDRFNVTVFEGASKPGGLIKCERVEGNLYHMVGGHVFNSKRKDVLEWFWKFFDQEGEFVKANRNAAIQMHTPIGYPIENHIYEMQAELQKKIIDDLLEIAKSPQSVPDNFEAFLKGRFGNTLYELYFKPYNEKIWKKDLSKVPISWLEGKLPMPTIEEIIFNNFFRAKETGMVHSSFFYAKQNGSQFLVDRLAEGLNIKCNAAITKIVRAENTGKWIINGNDEFDVVIFTGNIKSLPTLLGDQSPISSFAKDIADLEYHGTTTVLCEVDQNAFSWIYMPDKSHQAHRIICTGNFSDTNNAPGMMSATIEFTDYLDKDTVLDNLIKIPYSPRYIDHRFTEFTYPIQDANTRETVRKIKDNLQPHGFHLLGRFAEWEYYNMDAVMGAALDMSKHIS